MAKKEPLPERLQYLLPFRKSLAKIPKSEVGDTTDTSLLEKLLRDQLQGLTATQAQEKLAGDLEELEKYLSHHSDERLFLVVGFLLIAAEKPEELLKPSVELRKVEERLMMELPPRSKSTSDEYSLTIKWKRQHFTALKCNMEDDFSRKYFLTQLTHPNATDYELLELLGMSAPQNRSSTPQRQSPASSISLGKVIGHKHIDFSESPFVWKRGDYLLEIPGGYVSITIQADHLFDDSEWDPYLATLHYSTAAAVDAK